MENNKFSMSLFLILAFFGCQTAVKPQSSNKVVKLEKEQFSSFYQKFHTDSLFQISRIRFPLPGINSDDMTVEDTAYHWTKGKWMMHHLVDTTSFTRKLSVSNNTVIEVITSTDSGVIIKRTFQNIKGKWFLVRYEDTNL